MISFFQNNNKIQEHIETLDVDIHSHLIPGIDDGSKSMEESLALLREFKNIGYKKIITTPHIMDKAYGNTKESILFNFVSLQDACKEANIDIRIEVAAEYYVDEGFLVLIEKDELLAIDDEYILFETSYIHRPIDLESVIHNITMAGYKPLLAHPERYRYIKNPEKEFSELKDKGLMFQVNLNSFAGFYGKQAKKHAEYLNKASMINFVGSDVHGMSHMDSLKGILNESIYSDIIENNNILNNTL